MNITVAIRHVWLTLTCQVTTNLCSQMGFIACYRLPFIRLSIKYKNIMKRPEAFFKMKTEKENGTLTQLPNLHPSSKHEPDPNCEQCQGTGWIIYPIGHFKELGSELKYDGHDTTFCACTFFTDDVKELATSMISKTVSKFQS